jgi:hypothetical protein
VSAVLEIKGSCLPLWTAKAILFVPWRHRNNQQHIFFKYSQPTTNCTTQQQLAGFPDCTNSNNTTPRRPGLSLTLVLGFYIISQQRCIVLQDYCYQIFTHAGTPVKIAHKMRNGVMYLSSSHGWGRPMPILCKIQQATSPIWHTPEFHCLILFCSKANQLIWRNLALPNLFVQLIVNAAHKKLWREFEPSLTDGCQNLS